MMVSGSIGGRGAMTGYVTDKRTGQKTMVQGTSMDDILKGAADWSQKNQAMQPKSTGVGPGGSQGLNFNGNNSGNQAFQNQSMQQSQQIQQMRNQGMFGGTANQQGKPQTAFNTVPQGNTNVQYPMGNAALGIPPMNGGGGGVPGVPGSGGGGNVGALLQEQRGLNDAARKSNEQNWQTSRDNLLGLQDKFRNDPLNQGVRGQAQGLIDNPEALNDKTQAMIQNRASNAIQAQGDNQFKQAQGMMAATGQSDLSSQLAAQERIGRSTMAAQQASQTDLDIGRADRRNDDIMNAIKTGQGVTGQQYGLEQGVNQSILENLPQYKADDLSGWLAAGQGGGSGVMDGGGWGAMTGGMGGGQPMDAMQAEFGGSEWEGGGGFTKKKGPSTYGGFNYSTPVGVAGPGGQMGYTYQDLGVDPLATGGFGALGGAESFINDPYNKLGYFNKDQAMLQGPSSLNRPQLKDQMNQQQIDQLFGRSQSRPVTSGAMRR